MGRFLIRYDISTLKLSIFDIELLCELVLHRIEARRPIQAVTIAHVPKTKLTGCENVWSSIRYILLSEVYDLGTDTLTLTDHVFPLQITTCTTH